ncbi:MAG: hypothetical protein LBH75_05545 [Treponema sp.]|jgi:hypothetical protein|nr:hypothetical protein [Treponema sp.]
MMNGRWYRLFFVKIFKNFMGRGAGFLSALQKNTVSNRFPSKTPGRQANK